MTSHVILALLKFYLINYSTIKNYCQTDTVTSTKLHLAKLYTRITKKPHFPLRLVVSIIIALSRFFLEIFS